MIKQIIIARVSATDRKKDGSELTGKYGKFWRVGIQTKEHGEEWLNGFTSKEPVWIEGDEVTLDIKTEVWKKDDGTEVPQLKFRIPSKEDLKDAKIAELESELDAQKEGSDTISDEEVANQF